MISLAARLEALCHAARPSLPPEAASEIDDALARLQGPLRLAVAGRVKAGKSTLLNALLGERLAPTDAGERTRFITWYEYGPGYQVFAERGDGELLPLRFERDDDALVINDADLPDAGIRRLIVRWPTARLRRFTLIDTPGLGSASPARRAAAVGMLAAGQGGLRAADAVIYLMRHAHRSDVAFLEAFRDPSLVDASPVNALAMLSRADEIGGGRPDAMESAQRIAERYRRDPALKGLVGTVLPVCGLLAESAVTLREEEYDLLASLSLADPEAARALLSADRFRSWDASPVLPASLDLLLDRFGMFGLRYALRAIAGGEVRTSLDLARILLEASGLPALEDTLELQFGSRATRLISYSVLREVTAVASRLATASKAGRDLLHALEELASSNHEVDELRVLHLAVTGENGFTAQETEEVERLASGKDAHQRLGASGPGADDARQLAIRRAAAWRARVGDPLNDPIQDYSCEVLTRSYEAIAAEAAGKQSD